MNSPRLLRRVITVGAVLMVAMGLALLFLLTQATNDRALYERNYAWLFTINVGVAAALLAAVLWVAYRLYLRFKEGRFGSRLLVKLATIFALVGLAPGLLIYVVSYQFVSRSIETWFDVKVEGALEAGLNLGRVSLESFSSDLTAKAKTGATQLADSPESATAVVLERLTEQIGATEAVVWTATGNLIASAGEARFQISPDRPTPTQFRAARNDRIHSWFEGLEDTHGGTSPKARIRVLVPVSSSVLGFITDQRFLLVSRALPPTLVTNALAVEGAYREYQERALSREGLKRMYIGTLTLSLFLAVFGAVLLAVVLGNQIARPLLTVAEGVSQVAAGDLTPKLVLQGKDELVGLTRAFASMTAQLAEARQTVQDSMATVDAARANLQTILDNLTAGVIVLDAEGRIKTTNPGATRILKLPMSAHEGDRLSDVPGLQEFGVGVMQLFADHLDQGGSHRGDHWQQSFQIGAGQRSDPSGVFDQHQTLVARGAELPDQARLLVFDDITEIVSAQRAQAWGEVARRLAHEIKNPLTPIQLSAERLEMKLTGKLPEIEQAILVKSVKMIVDQVDAMKRLVNEFRDYARLPSADLKAVDLNAVVSDVAQLYDPDSQQVPIRFDLDSQCPMVLGDAQQLRQVIHNLLQNAQDASESNVERPLRSVTLQTKWVAETNRVRLSVMDYGSGFPDHILKRAFEPYVTTKARGTGLGLAVVKKIADEHGSRVDIANRIENGVVIGAQVSLSLAADKGAQS